MNGRRELRGGWQPVVPRGRVSQHDTEGTAVTPHVRMTSDYTQQQSETGRRAAEQLSRQRTRPPAELRGYEMRSFLGSGAYGEVWTAVDRNTGRQVAVKFYSHGGGVDWSLLSREVEKLVFLSADRYVVQLLEVGWEAEPPYYVMEYVENGSLEDKLRREGPMPVDRAVEIFREIAIGLSHAHNKGVLHCDLKPANVLLDQDQKPRLADFGQSRMTTDQTPALGTLFYMAPEQADLDAVPDTRWDVYGLGAVFYCLLTGEPPHRSEKAVTEIEDAVDLPDRLARYRKVIRAAPIPSGHRGKVDRALAAILDRCLAVEPEERYPSVQGVLAALQARDEVRARRPQMILGIVAPLLLLAIMALFALRGYNQAVHDSRVAVAEQAQESNRWTARYASETVAAEIKRHFLAVERVAEDPRFVAAVLATVDHPELAALSAELNDPLKNAEELAARDAFIEHPARQPLQGIIEDILHDPRKPRAASWFVANAEGTQIASAFSTDARSPVGKNYAYRTYFHGGPSDLPLGPAGTPREERFPPERRLERTHLSAAFPSTATDTWKVAVSTPIYYVSPTDDLNGEAITEDSHPEGRERIRFLGVLALTVDLGNFMQFNGDAEKFAVLVDGRAGETNGVILQHPLFDDILASGRRLPQRFSKYKVDLESLALRTGQPYQDPLGQDDEAKQYSQPWIASSVPVVLDRLEDGNGGTFAIESGLVVIVQESYDDAISPVNQLSGRLFREGIAALAVLLIAVVAMWFVVVRWMRPGQPVYTHSEPSSETGPSLHSATTIAGDESRE